MRTYRGNRICNPGVVVCAPRSYKSASFKISFDRRKFNFGKLSCIFRVFRVVWSSQWAVYAVLCGSKSSFHFLLRAQNKTKQKKRAPGTKPIFPTKRVIQLLQSAYPQASNVLRCSWMPSLHTPWNFQYTLLPNNAKSWNLGLMFTYIVINNWCLNIIDYYWVFWKAGKAVVSNGVD